MPPILKDAEPGLEPSLSSDVEVTLTADFFTQMRSTMNLQRALVNQMILDTGFATGNWWPPQPPSVPDPLTTREVLRYATQTARNTSGLDTKTGSLTPGKEADIIILDATALNVAPLNQVPGAVVSLMDRTKRRDRDRRGQGAQVEGAAAWMSICSICRRQLEASRAISRRGGYPAGLVPQH